MTSLAKPGEPEARKRCMKQRSHCSLLRHSDTQNGEQPHTQCTFIPCYYFSLKLEARGLSFCEQAHTDTRSRQKDTHTHTHIMHSARQRFQPECRKAPMSLCLSRPAGRSTCLVTWESIKSEYDNENFVNVIEHFYTNLFSSTRGDTFPLSPGLQDPESRMQ